MIAVAAVIEPGVGFYTAVRIEFADREPRRVIFAGLDRAVTFHERAEDLLRRREAWPAYVAAAEACAGCVSIGD
ncbi:hypothetical protein [Caulobacter sp.]|uniref:hypothetical protein n=1 Tax=Caulobacter sp. TaxID=78 RepID=UPI002B49681C|nr:hypothetical protein [Caulobacter sp.]HJV43150.1 hypothetical protein [Caulobacter sp.]